MKVCPVLSADQEWATFQQLVAECDVVYIIAPEFKNILATRCQYVRDNGKRLLNASPEAVRLCSDKYQLWELLHSSGIPTIETELIADVSTHSPTWFPLIVKPVDGAGALSTFHVESEEKWPAVRRQLLNDDEFATYISQPFIEGESCSALVYVGETVEAFPVGDQQISISDVICYQGGTIPGVDPSRQAKFAPLVEQISNAIPELVGLWGVDFIVPDSEPTKPLVMEINPRLTTSYVGYRRVTDNNIAERLVFQDRRYAPMQWNNQAVRFTPSGEFTLIGD